MNWATRYPGWAMFAAMAGLLAFLWGLAIPLAAAPEPIGPAAEQFADGARITVWLTLVAGSSGIVIGVLAGVGKLSRFWPLRRLCDAYVWLIRGTPLLLQILFVWLAAPSILPEDIVLSDFACAAIALALNVGAYNTECVRAGILAVPWGQVEAARALGLTPVQTFMDVVLPQSMRVALPALANNLASLVKDSSLAYAISVVELTMVGYRVQAESYQPIPVFVTTAVIYLILTTAFTTLTAALEAQLNTGQQR
ncbi:MAG TPA: amino acid ABC transporter permease [Accumulibacter sp.]|uniref:amino acid ABC transporter permease n=1 Tax=Accumulibacter sp. TaxID=2053492 RepID=UPI00262420CB|nr:amino acid ABC transporter permease [Accumulibacter sp.]MDS4055142.1 amino acid ABC transporter permease [Accumulibacter sp.]HMV04796.1 amino acid ABC transporter permease [Accumulibacter sp.]HMW63638.1 amino acid ABC transporter permease [Accumulibacter sp.]HMW80377.1 amino acid ABC transporter permease [Accumulibacter sp.]HMX67852.1 amino acid ABC transporter permease [Accumulibacter sp.]